MAAADSFRVLGPVTDIGFNLVASPDGRAFGTGLNRPKLLRGRLPDPARTDEAIADAMQTADYLAEKAGLNTSDKFLNATTQTYRLLAGMPGMGVQRRYNNPRLSGMRMFPLSGFRRYLVFYRASETELTILRVLASEIVLQSLLRGCR